MASRLTTNQEIAGSSPAVVIGFFFVLPHLFPSLSRNGHIFSSSNVFTPNTCLSHSLSDSWNYPMGQKGRCNAMENKARHIMYGTEKFDGLL